MNKSSLSRLQGELVPRTALILSANSKSTMQNVRRGKKLLKLFAELQGTRDPNEVTLGSSVFVMNLIAKYCKTGRPDSLRSDAVNCLIQGLRIVYEQHGHIDAWSVRDVRISNCTSSLIRSSNPIVFRLISITHSLVRIPKSSLTFVVITLYKLD